MVLDPTAANYWQLVAKKVPGKTANECYAKMFESHPTPQEKNARARRYLGSLDEDGGPAGQAHPNLGPLRPPRASGLGIFFKLIFLF